MWIKNSYLTEELPHQENPTVIWDCIVHKYLQWSLGLTSVIQSPPPLFNESNGAIF